MHTRLCLFLEWNFQSHYTSYVFQYFRYICDTETFSLKRIFAAKRNKCLFMTLLCLFLHYAVIKQSTAVWKVLFNYFSTATFRLLHNLSFSSLLQKRCKLGNWMMINAILLGPCDSEKSALESAKAKILSSKATTSSGAHWRQLALDFHKGKSDFVPKTSKKMQSLNSHLMTSSKRVLGGNSLGTYLKYGFLLVYLSITVNGYDHSLKKKM